MKELNKKIEENLKSGNYNEINCLFHCNSDSREPDNTPMYLIPEETKKDKDILIL